MAGATVKTTVGSTLNDVRVVELSCGARAVHLGVRQQADDRRAVGVDQQRLGAGKQHGGAAAGLAALLTDTLIYRCHQHPQT